MCSPRFEMSHHRPRKPSLSDDQNLTNIKPHSFPTTDQIVLRTTEFNPTLPKLPKYRSPVRFSIIAIYRAETGKVIRDASDLCSLSLISAVAKRRSTDMAMRSDVISPIARNEHQTDRSSTPRGSGREIAQRSKKFTSDVAAGRIMFLGRKPALRPPRFRAPDRSRRQDQRVESDPGVHCAHQHSASLLQTSMGRPPTCYCRA
jgi:hypothetical protein